MATNKKSKVAGLLVRLSLDGWAVGAALLLAALVRLGVLKQVPW